jgi:hypothetical protein
MERRTFAALAAVVLTALAPVGRAGPSTPDVERARRELIEALARQTPPEPAAVPGADAAIARAGVERLRLHDVRVRVTGVLGVPLPGVSVRGLHDQFDLSSGPVATDASGRATLRLPYGVWSVDVSRVDPGGGGCVFARVPLQVDSDDERRIELPARRTIRFKRKSGASQAPSSVSIALPDFSFRLDVPPRDGAFDIVTLPRVPLVLQATDPPGDHPGYVLRRTIDADATVVVDEDEGTRWSFRGANGREVAATLTSADALPFEMSFATDAAKHVVLAGMPLATVALEIRRGEAEYGFHALPLALDGKSRAFTGEPPFDASVGVRRNTMKEFGARRGSLSVRVFLREENGLVLRGGAKKPAFEVDWEERLDDRPLASGTMRKSFYVRTAPVDAGDVARLSWRLRVRGPPADREVDVKAAGPVEAVVGKVRVHTSAELLPNARLWAACADDAVRAYEDVTTARRSVVNVDLFGEMPPRTAGWGGFAGNRGWTALPEGWVFGFSGCTFWNGLLGHELGHVQGFGHGTAMKQAGRRAARRYASIRPGTTRVPEGDRFRPVLEAVTSGALRCDLPPEDDDADDARAAGTKDHSRDDVDPDVEAQGEDEFLTWYLRAAHGRGAEHLRRTSEAAWRWTLTIAQFTDDEIEAAILSRACAGSSRRRAACSTRSSASRRRRSSRPRSSAGGRSSGGRPISRRRRTSTSTWRRPR